MNRHLRWSLLYRQFRIYVLYRSSEWEREQTMKRSHTIATLQQQEAQRRLKLLRPLVNAPYDYQQLRHRAKEVYLPTKVLWNWWQQYQERNLDGLLPTDCNLSEMTEKMQFTIYQRLT